ISEKTAEQALKKQNAIFKESHKLFPVAEILNKNKALKTQQIYRILTEQKRYELAKRYYQEANPDEENLKSASKKDPPEDNEKAKTEIKIEVSEDNLEAKLYPVDKETDIEEIKNSVKEKGINFGLTGDEEIKHYIQSGSKEPFTIARGKKPLEPVNAEIKCHFSTNYLNVGNIDEEGNIDFMDRGEVPYVNEEELLAEKIPMQEGISGTDIFGSEIPVEEPKDILIKAEQNTRIDETTSKVYSTLRGKPHISVDGKISVLNVHEIKGDVDFRTGHIEFNGNIIIHGTVKPGFKVSGNDITVDEISGGEINAKGFLDVKSGISRGKVFAEQGVNAKFINQSKITALGNIKAEKEILESDLKTSGIITASSGKIISSVISAKGGIDAKQIGTEVSSPSTLEIGSSAYLDYLLNPLNEELEKIDKTVEDLYSSKTKESEKSQKAHIEIAEKAQIQDKANQALNKLNEHFDLVSMSGSSATLEEIQNKIDDLTKKVNDYETIMENLFYTQDSSQEAIEKIDEDLEKYENQKQEIKEKIEALRNYDNSLAPSPVLLVHGTIEKGTKVAGRNSLWKVHETTKNIRAYEIETKDQDGNPVHIVKVDKPK
ncbi:MAG: FapA family protein, partial [Thermodesulfobacteriota bacterium]